MAQLYLPLKTITPWWLPAAFWVAVRCAILRAFVHALLTGREVVVDDAELLASWYVRHLKIKVD